MEMATMTRQSSLAALLATLFTLLLPPVAHAGTLYLGTDNSIGGPGLLGIYTTNGPTVTSKTVVFPADGRQFNGVGEGLGLIEIVTGGWGHEFDKRDLAGNMITQSDNFFTPYATVNEDFAGNGKQIWRLVYTASARGLYLLNPDGTTNQAHTLLGNPGLVGLTFAGPQLWASDFDTGTIGTVNTSTDTYAPLFTPSGLPAQVGGLAYDAGGGVLWIGSGGVIAPFDLAGNRLGANVDTTGQLGSGFIDGVAFINGPTVVPEPASLISVGLGAGLVLAYRWRWRRGRERGREYLPT
jgi:hypothetical protein